MHENLVLSFYINSYKWIHITKYHSQDDCFSLIYINMIFVMRSKDSNHESHGFNIIEPTESDMFLHGGLY